MKVNNVRRQADGVEWCVRPCGSVIMDTAVTHTHARRLYIHVRGHNVCANANTLDSTVSLEDSDKNLHKINVYFCLSFRAMFERWSSHHIRDFTLGGVSPQIMDLLLEWIYTKSTTFLSRENVQEVLVAADMLLLEKLGKICYCYMEDHMCPENCISIWKFCHVVLLHKTKDLAWRFIMSHFEEVFTYKKLTHIRLIRPRLPGAILLAIGGWSGDDPTNGIEAYDYKADRWVNVTNHQERARAYHGSVFLNGFVYCVGGFDGTEHFNSVRRLDLATRTWHEMPPMYHRRCYVSVAVLNGCIYAMGGYNGHIRLNTAEVFDSETNQWSQIPPMNEQRSDANCAAVNGKVGGFDGNVRLRSVEAYSPHRNSWRPVASMMDTRSNFGIEVLNGRIFAAGGFNGFSTTYTVEAYDPLMDSWSVVCDMDIFRSALNCCVISGLPNMADYAISRNALPLLDIGMDESDESDVEAI
uniref:BTB domain-containing protein n=1 Tax=Periophthalmus magnuspinnatus TaxID=409849 RepID=A0A3B3ZI08_9GOBI